MAIHPDHPGLTVEVTVDDQPLEEYTDADDVTDPKTITRYTDARYGAEFAIKFNFESPFPANSDVGYKIWVDGKLVKAAFVYQRQLLIRGPYITSGAKIKGKAGWYLQRFCFADLRISKYTMGPECRERSCIKRRLNVDQLKTAQAVNATFKIRCLHLVLSRYPWSLGKLGPKLLWQHHFLLHRWSVFLRLH
jgi:hypothetical protein